MTEKPAPITTPPPPEEMARRLETVRGLMRREELDYYVVAHTDNVYYLTNFAYLPFERPFFLIVPASGRLELIVPELEVSHAQGKIVGEADIRTYYEFPAPPGRTYVDALRDALPADKAVGLESSLSLGLSRVVPGRTKVADVVDEARLVKTEYEVGRIAYASAVVRDGLNKALELSRPETAVLTIYSEGVRQMMGRVIMEIPSLNLLVSKFLCAVWPKAISAHPHSHPGLFDTLEPGGPNVCIVTAQADGYSAELERTYFLGRAPEQAKAPFEAAMEARSLAYELIKPGAAADAVDAAVLDLITKRGYGENILHRTGHGFGITGHEPPWVARGSDTVFEPNMVISIEPGVYLPGVGGFRHSDTVLVTDNGCLSLTEGPQSLEDLTLPV